MGSIRICDAKPREGKIKNPEGAKMSSESRSARVEDTGRMEVDAMR